jgi:hypothetical protein
MFRKSRFPVPFSAYGHVHADAIPHHHEDVIEACDDVVQEGDRDGRGNIIGVGL